MQSRVLSFPRFRLFLSTSFIAYKMSTHQANKDKPRAQKCRHFCFSFDTHNFCPTCREAGKGDDPCVTFETPCEVCTSFTDEQLQKIQNRKRYLKKQKATTSSKDELDLLGEGDGDSFTGSNADLQCAADSLFISPPRPQPLAFSSLSLKTPQPTFQDKIQELNTDFAKICITPRPSGPPVARVPLPVLKELELQARQNISTLNFTAAFAKTSSSCNASLEKCQHSIKSTVKKIKSQIQKGADPERAAKRGYEEVADYLDFWNKTVLVQHRALTCLSKSLAHILQRELYSMANTGLLRREAEMTLLHPELGETRRQELRNSSFWDASLFESQLVKEGEDFLLKKGTSKDSQGFPPYQNKPFRGPHKKRGSYRKRPYGGNTSQSSNQSFPSGRGKSNFRGFRGRFRPHNRGRGRGNPPPQ